VNLAIVIMEIINLNNAIKKIVLLMEITLQMAKSMDLDVDFVEI